MTLKPVGDILPWRSPVCLVRVGIDLVTPLREHSGFDRARLIRALYVVQIGYVPLYALALTVAHESQGAHVMAVASVHDVRLEVVVHANPGGHQAKMVNWTVCIRDTLFQGKV